jgi:hypothetical protein
LGNIAALWMNLWDSTQQKAMSAQKMDLFNPERQRLRGMMVVILTKKNLKNVTHYGCQKTKFLLRDIKLNEVKSSRQYLSETDFKESKRRKPKNKGRDI